VGPRAGLDTEVRVKILFLCRRSNPENGGAIKPKTVTMIVGMAVQRPAINVVLRACFFYAQIITTVSTVTLL
jgi:hypothetical protein